METRAALDPECVPLAVRRLVLTLAEAGYRTVLVGGCVRDLLRGESVRDFDVATQAAPEAILRLFPRAIPIGIRHGTLMIPTAGGPVDVTSLRAGPRVEDDLAHRDFTVNAIAFDPIGGALVDPFDGRTDLARGRLRAVRSARDRFREDPLRMLRGARLVATLGLKPEAEIAGAMRECAPLLDGVARERVRAELTALVLGDRAGAGLELLRRTGIEAQLAPDAAADGPAVVDALPPELELRLAAWLRGARALSILQRLRFPKRSAERVERLLRLHPALRGVDPAHAASVRRLLRRTGTDLEALLRLCRAELAAAGGGTAQRERLDALEAAALRVRRAGEVARQRFDLALDGRAVMATLGCGPGPAVGEALAFLTDQIVEDPACNTPEGLGALLERWWAERAGGRGKPQA